MDFSPDFVLTSGLLGMTLLSKIAPAPGIYVL